MFAVLLLVCATAITLNYVELSLMLAGGLSLTCALMRCVCALCLTAGWGGNRRDEEDDDDDAPDAEADDKEEE